MKSFFKKPWVIAIVTTVVGTVLATCVIDLIRGVDWLSTFKVIASFFGKIVGSFLNFELKVWWVLAFLVVVIVGFIIFTKMYDTKPKSTAPSFLEYKKDFLLGYTWRWEYEKGYDGKYNIVQLRPVCSTCGMTLKEDVWDVECLRCNNALPWDESKRRDARMLILDNIEKKYFQNH